MGDRSLVQINLLRMSSTISAVDMISMTPNLSINICGILWLIHDETSGVKEQVKLTLMDRSGIIKVKSCLHSGSQFEPHVGKPILIYRVRVQLIDGEKWAVMVPSSGRRWEEGASVWHVNHFAGANDLVKFWLSAAAAKFRRIAVRFAQFRRNAARLVHLRSLVTHVSSHVLPE